MAKQVYVRVQDRGGSEFLCPLDSLKDPASASEEELANCVDRYVVERYAGDIEVKD
jgi:hypothetical protein